MKTTNIINPTTPNPMILFSYKMDRMWEWEDTPAPKNWEWEDEESPKKEDGDDDEDEPTRFVDLDMEIL